MVPMQILIFLFTLYFFVIGFCGMWRKKEVKIKTPRKTFALVVAAHNEHAVIEQLVLNLKQLNYPKDMYDIYVIADNCTDNTAEIAEKAGAIVQVRTHPTKKSKGYALQWMFDRLFKMDKQYDAVCVFDADNLVHPQFLMEMNNRLCKGDKVIQGYMDAKNPYDTWVSGTFAIAFWVICYISHLAKSNIGLSACLGGTGMCFDSEILKKHGWQATCLTEDMEFTMKCMAEGIKTSWAHDAIIYDEKPLTFKQSWNQRRRWAQGQFDCSERYIPILWKEGWKRHSIVILDGIMQLLQNYFLLVSTFYLLMTYINMFYPCFTVILYNDVLVPHQFWAILGFIQSVVPLIVLLQIKVPWKIYLYWLIYPVFMYSWIPVTILGWKDRHEKGWVHTIHTRSMHFEQASLTRKKEIDS